MFRNLIFVSTFLFALVAGSLAHADFQEGKSGMLFDAAFDSGGLVIGFDYEYGYHKTYGLGAYFRMNPDNQPDDDGFTAFGAFIRPHFNRQAWDFYISPGFGMISYEPRNNADSESLIGPSFAIGLLYEISPTISFGVENMKFYGWFGEEKYRNLIADELTASFRLIFN